MFRALARLSVAAVLLAVLAPDAFAQSWNRRISDIRIVHPPGTPPGTWRLQAGLEFLASDSAPQPIDMDFDLVMSVNGAPFGLESVDAGPLLVPNACQFQCPSTVCMQFSLTSLTATAIVDSFCYDPPGPTYDCNCWTGLIWWWFQTDLVLQPTDVVVVTITARPGSLPEIDTSDDALTILAGTQAPGTPFCAGDGTGTACPCGNNGSPGNGCANSVNPAGAQLNASGNASVTSDSVVLAGSGMTNSACLYFQGTSQAGGGSGVMFGDGLRCVSGSVIRLGTESNVAGASQYPGPGELPVSLKGAIPALGGTRTYQAWYRNAQDYCTANTYNLTNGMSIVWLP